MKSSKIDVVMKYDKIIILKNCKECRLRNGDDGDGQSVIYNANGSYRKFEV